jgi:hypothetical protein
MGVMSRLFAAPPAEREYVFIITYGRSGSTLLMGLLNSLPGFCLRGENGNALYGLFETHRRLAAAQQATVKNSEKPTHPWFGLNRVDLAAVRNGMRKVFTDTVLCPEPEHRVIGFKEIRFSEAEVPLFAEYIEFIRDTFPGCKIIFNHRNLANVAASGWWKGMPAALEKLELMEGRFNAVPASDWAHHFSYDAFIADPDYAKELMAFLGQPYDGAAMRRVIATRHSY